MWEIPVLFTSRWRINFTSDKIAHLFGVIIFGRLKVRSMKRGYKKGLFGERKWAEPSITPTKGAFTNPPGPVRFSNPAACRRISRPCGTLPNFISTAFMVTYPTEPGRCPVDI